MALVFEGVAFRALVEGVATPSTSALNATPSKTSAILIYTTAKGNSSFQQNPIVILAKKIEITCQRIWKRKLSPIFVAQNAIIIN